MRRYAPHFLLSVNAALVLCLLWLWFTPDGALRNVHWQAPAAQKSDFAAMLPGLPGVTPADTSHFIAMLDRPLFSITRRPPPPPPPPPASSPEPPPVDNLSTASLSGVFEGTGVGGIIINIAGKDRRVSLNDMVDGWKVQTIAGRDVTFSRNGQTRQLTLPRAALTTYTGLVSAPQASQATPVGARAVSASSQASDSAAAAEPSAQTPRAPPRAVFGGSRR